MSDSVRGDRLIGLIRDLDRDPIFAMSLGSKGLFHSNLLARFIGHRPPVAHALGLPSAATVLREKHHTDLLISAGGQAPMIIENKVFSLPDCVQLDQIGDKLGYLDSEFVLLRLTDPGWTSGTWRGSGERIWTWLSYGDLVDKLKPAVSAVAGKTPTRGPRWRDGSAS